MAVIPESLEIINAVKQEVQTPCFVVFESALKRNMAIIQKVIDRTNVRVLLAQKAFSMYHTYPLLRETLSGTCSSGPHEARLGKEMFGGEVHAFAAAFSRNDLASLLENCNHIVFNSFQQLERFSDMLTPYLDKVEFGIRVNPEHSEGHTPIYDPCGPGSRLGTIKANFPKVLPKQISGLHFHTLCQHNSDAFARTLAAFEEKFAEYLPHVSWVNFGGGHHITRPDYDLDLLCDTINGFKERHPHIKTIYLEPGEAIALDAGILVTEILDISKNNDVNLAIVDASAAAHMPDVIEMPYRPEMVEEIPNGEISYRFGGHSCLAGDIIGDYSFDQPLEVGNRVTLLDMAIYSMVKTTTFNGLQLPSIAYYREKSGLEYVKKFGYEDFKSRV
ncbi:MAG: carboxynorspermidine decarboxylase [Lentisphaeria bacterium]